MKFFATVREAICLHNSERELKIIEGEIHLLGAGPASEENLFKFTGVAYELCELADSGALSEPAGLLLKTLHTYTQARNCHWCTHLLLLLKFAKWKFETHL